MNLLKSWEIPIEVVSEANISEHWSKSSKRHKNQKRFVRYFLSNISVYSNLPITIKLIRISPRMLDEHDNLRTAFKYVVDAIADLIYPGKKAGRADDTKLITWEYAQEKGKEKSIRIEIYESKNLA